MQIIYANFQDDDNFVELFSKYKDEVGDLFQDGNQILSNQDYCCLYKRLANIAEWSLKPALHPCPSAETFVERITNNEILRIPAGEKKYFYRCFGIYLREATMRYGADFTSEGGFWNSMATGIQADLQDAYASQNSGTQRPRNGFWGNNGIREELTIEKLRGKTLLEYVFSFFDNPEIGTVQRGVAYYFVRHLIKIAICPLNYNPLRNDYENLLSNNQSIEAQLNMAERHTLDYHTDTRRQLVARITYYFQGLSRIRHNYNGVDIDEYISNVLRSHFHIENPQHYFSDWLRRDLTNANARPVVQTGRRINPREMNNAGLLNGNYQMSVSYNTRSRSVIVKAPSDLDLDVLFGADLHLDPFGFYEVLGKNDEVLLRIEERQVQKPNGRDAYNVNAFKIFELDSIKIRDEDGLVRSAKNPWVLKKDPCFIFDNNGRSVEKAFEAGEHRSYVIVLPEGERITSIRYRGNGHEPEVQMPVFRNQNGLAVYDWISDLDANVDGVVIEVKCADGHYRQLNYEVNDSRYLHIYEDKDLLEQTRFMYQQRGKKVGVGTLYLTHLSNDVHPQVVAEQINQQVGTEVASVDESIGRSHATRLKLTNGGHSVLYIPELEVDGGKVVPSIILLPADAYFWMACPEGNRFCAYLKSKQGIVNLPRCWERKDDGKYIYHVDDYETWERCGFPISFADNTPCVFSRKPYFKRLLNLKERMYFASEFFWSSNLFDDLIPKDALLYFKWTEANRVFEAKIPSIHPANKCLECFELVGCYPDMTFGWIYEGTEFLVKLFSDQNANPLPQRNADVYEMTDEERSIWLRNRVERDTINLKNLLNTFNQAFFGQDYEIKGLADFDNVHNPDDALRIVGLKYLDSIEDFRRDLISLSVDEKLVWLRNWLAVSDWNDMLNYLQTQLAEREDSLNANLCIAKKFNSPAEIDNFVAGRFIQRAYADLLNDLLKQYNVATYRYALPLNRINVVGDKDAFSKSFGEIVSEYKKSCFCEEWNRIAETNCPELVGYSFAFRDFKGATVTWTKNEAQRMFSWCTPLMRQLNNWNLLNLFVPDCLSDALKTLSIDEISMLAGKLTKGICDYREYAQHNNLEISYEQIASIFNINEGTFKGISAKNNTRLDFNKIKFGEMLLRQKLECSMTECNKNEQLNQILNGNFLSKYVSENQDNLDVERFLEYVAENSESIFEKEKKLWRLALFGRGLNKAAFKIPGECLLKDSSEYRQYIMNHPEMFNV